MAGSISLSALRELFAHNYWARDRQLTACATGGTLVHLLAVEWRRLERWRGRSPRVLLAPEEFPTLAAVCDRWNAVEQETKRYLAELPEGALEQEMTCTGTRGNTWTYALWRLMVRFAGAPDLSSGTGDCALAAIGSGAAESRLLRCA